jgi:hypothetical protein
MVGKMKVDYVNETVAIASEALRRLRYDPRSGDNILEDRPARRPACRVATF